MRSAFVLLLILNLLGINLYAQHKLKLKNVNKIVFFTKIGGWGNNNFSKYEVVPEGNTWKCYQTTLIKITIRENINDTSRRLLTNVPENLLAELVALVNKPDTAININFFKADKAEMVKYLDSLKRRPLSSTEKSNMIEAIQSTEIINKAFYSLYHPTFRMGDDRDENGIIITTKKNTRINVMSSVFGFLDYEPWYINGVVSYNPNISRIFEFIAGDKNYAQKSQKRFYLNMDAAIYYELYKKMNW